MCSWHRRITWFAEGSRRRERELENHDGIFYTNRGVADWRFVSGGRTMMVRTRARLTVNNGDMIHDAAIARTWYRPFADVMAAPRSARKVRVIEIGIHAEEKSIFIAHPEGRQASAKLRALAQHLRATFGTPPYWEGRPKAPGYASNIAISART